jgi:hypothetical protein
MEQPVIDPDKVDAWTASMRGAFSGNADGLTTWLAIGAILATLILLGFALWRARTSRPQDPLAGLRRLAAPTPQPKPVHHSGPASARRHRA